MRSRVRRGAVVSIVAVLLVSAVATFPMAAAAGPVFVESDITQDTTWTAAEGPYRIVANVTVAPDATLRIEPGTTVQVAEGISLSVAGSLHAAGTAAEPVTFTSPRAEPGPGVWGSIRPAGDSSVTVTLEHATVEYATDGVLVANPRTALSVENVTFAMLSGDGIAVPGAGSATDLTVRATEFRSIGGDGVSAGDSVVSASGISGWQIADATFQSLGGAAVDLEADAVTRLYVTDTRVRNASDGGVHVTSTELRNTDLARNLVSESGDAFRVRTDALSNLQVSHNTVRRSGIGVNLTATRNVRALEITRNDITDGTTGVELTHATAPNRYFSFATTVARNRLSGNAVHGLLVETGLATPPSLSVHNNSIEENGWYGARFAMADFRNAVVANNTLSRNGEDGLSIDGRHVRAAEIRDNTARENEGAGIAMNATGEMSGVRVTDNRLLDNAGSGLRVGTVEAHAGNVTVRDNLVAANAYGVVVSGPQTAIIEHNEIVYNTVRVGPVQALSRVDPGVGIVAADGRDNLLVAENDIYGHRIGLFVDTGGTVEADTNYWGAASGPYHQSINPEGEGDVVVTRRGWADIIHAETERIGHSRARPVARLDVDPETATVGEQVHVSGGGSSDADGQVRTYHVTIGNESAVLTEPVTEFAPVETGTVQVSLIVEDDLGIDSANTARATVTVEPAPTTTTTPSTTPPSNTTSTTSGSMTTTTPAPVGPTDQPSGGLLGAFVSIGGVVGAAFYLVALVLGGWGMFQTLTEQPLSVDGRRIHVLAVVGIVVWAAGSLLGPGELLSVSLVGLVAWVALTGIAYIVARGT